MFRKILTELCLITVLFLGISSQAWALFPMGMEIHMGEDAAIKIENTYPATEDKRVTEIGNKLAQYSIRNGLEYKFKVLHGMRQENAFALPGGYVYITEELLDYTGNDDDQLAFILGHEIGHCDARHAMEKYETGLIVSIIFGTTMKGSDYAGIVASIASLSFLKYSRNDEIEADNFGFRFCYRTGYNPVKGLKVFKHFAELSGGGNKSDFLSTHPNPDSRIENAIKFMTAVDQAGGVVAYDLANKNYDYICVAGFWNSNIGKIMLVQDDADIYGICEDKLWKFEGKIKNKGLEIEWEDLRDENIKGTASLELKPDGSICSGKWYTGENQEVSQDATFTDRHLYDGPNRSANRYAGNEFKGIDLETAGTYFICKANDTYYNITGVKEGSATYAEEQLEICKKSCETPKELDFEENWGYKPGAFAGIKEFSFDLPGEVTFYANKALECFEIDVKQSPDDEDALLLLGVARVWKEDIDGGIKCFEDALIQDPSNEKACINAGDCYLWKKDEARALEYYKKAVTANPQSSTAYNRLGIYYYSKNQYREASEEFTEATKINVKNYCDYGNAALCYYKLGEFDKARRQLDFAATFNAEYAPVYYYQGRLYAEKNINDKAESSFRLAIQSNRKHAGACYCLGKLYLAQNNPQKSREYFRSYLYLFPGSKVRDEVKEIVIALDKELGGSTQIAMSPSDMIKTGNSPAPSQTPVAAIYNENNAADKVGNSIVDVKEVSITYNQTKTSDILITPGIGVELIVELGNEPDNFKSSLGEPENAKPGKDGFYYIYAKSKGINIVCRYNKVEFIAIFSPKYKTKENICVGTTAEKISQVYGECNYEEIKDGVVPGILEKRPNLSYIMNYDGISFVFNKDNKLSVILFKKQ